MPELRMIRVAVATDRQGREKPRSTGEKKQPRKNCGKKKKRKNENGTK